MLVINEILSFICMKILWFEISIPSRYRNTGQVTAGWQDALENIVLQCKDIKLYVAFESTQYKEVRVIDGITYIPMYTHYSFWERKRSQLTWTVNEHKVIEQGRKVIELYRPDLIQVFGNEWPYGLLAQYTDTPLVIHIQGSIVPYNNALYPPRYNGYTMVKAAGFNLRKDWHRLNDYCRDKSRLEMERRIWKVVHHYMGRTSWDKALVNTLTKAATYHHVDEALRPEFLNTKKHWMLPPDKKIKLLSVGCSSFWKGIDVMLKTAHVLKEAGADFEWNVAGGMSDELKQIVESKEHLKYADNNIRFLGFCSPERLIDEMCQSTMYVHTAYIENSPNSICEAQLIGMPIVSTMVGGVATLVRNGVEGDLLPANDPWQLANAIVELAKDKGRMKAYSVNSRQHALERHNPEHILQQLLGCYKDLMKK